MEFIYENNRIYAEGENHLLLAEVTFPARDETRVNIDHVYVDHSLRGGGVAQDLMLKAYDYIKSKNLKIIAKCPYAISWFKRFEQYQDIVINVKTKRND